MMLIIRHPYPHPLLLAYYLKHPPAQSTDELIFLKFTQNAATNVVHLILSNSISEFRSFCRASRSRLEPATDSRSENPYPSKCT